MNDWNWDGADWNEAPSEPQEPAAEKPKRPKTFWDLLADQFLLYLVLLIAFFGFKMFAGQSYPAFRKELEKRLSETTTLDTVLGETSQEPAPSAETVSQAETETQGMALAEDPYPEYEEESEEDCEFDLSKIRQLSGKKQSVNGMCMPIASQRVTSVFGYRLSPITGRYAMHSGLDLGADMGEPIYAALSGRVVKSKYNVDYGNFITLDHGDGLVTLYAHCSELLVEVGDEVKKGQVIARAGSTGWSTGPHLHFEVRVQGVRIDPTYYLPSLYTA